MTFDFELQGLFFGFGDVGGTAVVGEDDGVFLAVMVEKRNA